MAYSLTPFIKPGVGHVSTTGSSTTVQASYVKGFRNVAVGALITGNSLSRTVITKTDDDTVVVSSPVDWSTPADIDWVYTNPTLTLTGIYYIKHTKNNKPSVIPTTTGDADRALVSRGDSGVYREIQVAGFIQTTTLADLIAAINVLESFNDGTQCLISGRNNVFTEDLPPRSSYVWVTSINWQYSRDKPTWIDITINMVEKKANS